LNQHYLAYVANGVGNNTQRIFGYSASGGTFVLSIKATQLRKPGMLLALTESGESEAKGTRTNSGYCIGPGNQAGNHPTSVWMDRITLDEGIKQRHNDGCNILFMDSHVGKKRSGELLNVNSKDDLWGYKLVN